MIVLENVQHDLDVLTKLIAAICNDGNGKVEWLSLICPVTQVPGSGGGDCPSCPCIRDNDPVYYCCLIANYINDGSEVERILKALEIIELLKHLQRQVTCSNNSDKNFHNDMIG